MKRFRRFSAGCSLRSTDSSEPDRTRGGTGGRRRKIHLQCGLFAFFLAGVSADLRAAPGEYRADFEAPTFHPGDLNGQHQWVVDQGRAVVGNELGIGGSAALLLLPGNPFSQARLKLNGEPIPGDITFVDVHVRPAAATAGNQEEFLDIDSARIGFFRTEAEEQAVLWIFHGDGEGGGEWLATSAVFPVEADSGRSADWIRLTIREDTRRQTWDLWADGQWVCASAGFQENRDANSPVCIIMGDIEETVCIDDLSICVDNPAFPDQDRDGIPDHVEHNLGFDAGADDRDLDSDGDGLRNLEAALAWLSRGEGDGGNVLIPVEIRLSANSGFRDEPFFLAISGHRSDHTVYYTQNGSDPAGGGEEVYEYTQPIRVDRTQVLRVAVYSGGSVQATASAAWVFPAALGHSGEPPAGWPRSFRTAGRDWILPYGMDLSDQEMPGVVDALRSAPVVMLGIDRADLFGASSGIYARSERRLSAPAEVVMIDPHSGIGETARASVSLSGESSRRHEVTMKHSFRLGFIDSHCFLFGGKNLLLRNPTHDSWTQRTSVEQRREALYFADSLTSSLLAGAGHPQLRHRFVHVFLNEMYWGVYDALEQDSLPPTRILLEPDQKGMARAIFGTADEWRAWISGLEILSDAAQLGEDRESEWEEAIDKVDAESLIDYILINCWAGNLDWPAGNWLITKGVNGFTFISWDAEQAFRRSGGEGANRIQAIRTAADGPALAFYRLLNYPAFRVMVSKRFDELTTTGGVLSDEIALAAIDSEVSGFRILLPAEAARWGGDYQLERLGVEDWEEAVGWLRGDFLAGRNRVLRSQLEILLHRFVEAEARALSEAEARKSYTTTAVVPDEPLDSSDFTDADGDGIADEWEVLHSLDPYVSTDAFEDPDGDGLRNYQEAILGRDPNVADVSSDVFFPRETYVFTPFDGSSIRGGRAVPLHPDVVGRD